MIQLQRYEKNPILTGNPERWWESKYVYNAGAAIHDGKVQILYRAEGDEMRANTDMRWPISRLGLAVSEDGYHITERRASPVLEGAGEKEAWGIEDPRISKIGDTYHIVYVQVAEGHTGLALAATKDFDVFEKRWPLMPEIQQRTSGLLPEKIKGEYVLLHRVRPNVQIAYSSDLKEWHGSRPLMLVRLGMWDCQYMGIGAQPLKTEKGWLLFYHATDEDAVYRLGIAWLDLEDPSIVRGRLDYPILEPVTDFEKEGLFPNVVYTCGAVEKASRYLVYYGASDSVLCVASVDKDEVLSAM